LGRREDIMNGAENADALTTLARFNAIAAPAPVP
jgi:hypothetical protein